MNQRMRELAAEAYRAVDPGPDPYNEAEAAWVGFGALERKFAELIVRECARVAKTTEADDGDDYKSGRQWAGIEILKHFNVGVEE